MALEGLDHDLIGPRPSIPPMVAVAVVLAFNNLVEYLHTLWLLVLPPCNGHRDMYSPEPSMKRDVQNSATTENWKIMANSQSHAQISLTIKHVRNKNPATKTCKTHRQGLQYIMLLLEMFRLSSVLLSSKTYCTIQYIP
jgi:hypothetical protein